jgi:hypothetical protein
VVRVMRALLAMLVLAPLMAGCVDVGPDRAAGPTISSPSLNEIMTPRVDARATLDALKTFSESFPYRQEANVEHLMSRDWLASAMTTAGLDVVRQKFPSGSYQGENIIGIKWGADRANWTVVGAHYDVTQGAVFGTYDDGSGTLETLKLGEAFAKVPTDRTIAFIEFDQEEKGLVGSAAFVKSVLEGTFEHAVTVTGMIDLDMVGITWPHPAKLVCWENSDEIKALTEDARRAVHVPDANIEYRKPRGGSSDGASFIKVGIPTIYCWSDWDEVVLKDGTAAPSTVSYPWWHRADTYDTMVAMAGDETTLQAGFQTTLDIVGSILAHMASASTELNVRG